MKSLRQQLLPTDWICMGMLGGAITIDRMSAHSRASHWMIVLFTVVGYIIVGMGHCYWSLRSALKHHGRFQLDHTAPLERVQSYRWVPPEQQTAAPTLKTIVGHYVLNTALLISIGWLIWLELAYQWPI